MKSTKSEDPATMGNWYGTAAATDDVLIFLLISYLFLSRDSSDSVPPPISSWYVSPIRKPRSTRRPSTFRCRIVDPIWSIMSSPASGTFARLYLDCHCLFDAIRAGVALMNAHLD